MHVIFLNDSFSNTILYVIIDCGNNWYIQFLFSSQLYNHSRLYFQLKIDNDKNWCLDSILPDKNGPKLFGCHNQGGNQVHVILIFCYFWLSIIIKRKNSNSIYFFFQFQYIYNLFQLSFLKFMYTFNFFRLSSEFYPPGFLQAWNKCLKGLEFG